MDIECGGFTFVSNFDSGNLVHVELVSKKQNGQKTIGSETQSDLLMMGVKTPETC